MICRIGTPNAVVVLSFLKVPEINRKFQKVNQGFLIDDREKR